MTKYLNFRGAHGVETVDEFTREEGQSYSEYFKYVRKMANEYNIAGMDVYISSRATKEWRTR